MRFGSHVSIAGHLHQAIDRAVAVGCDAAQIFPGNPRAWAQSELSSLEASEFRERRRRAGIGPIAMHLPYLVNLATPDNRVFNRSVELLRGAIGKARDLDADFLVMHPGSHGGEGPARGIRQVVSGLKMILDDDFGPASLLLENTAGAGHGLGADIAEFAEIVAGVGLDERVGMCLDTCHAYAAGYDIASAGGLKSFMGDVSEYIGLDRLRLVHANDCKGALGSRLDRHEHIGAGEIGIEGWKLLLSQDHLAGLAWIIETPKKDPQDDPRNLALLRRLRAAVTQARSG